MVSGAQPRIWIPGPSGETRIAALGGRQCRFSPRSSGCGGTCVTVGQANVNGTKLKRCAIPLPPAAEQQRIIGFIDETLSKQDATSSAIQRDLARCARLRQAILKWAFEGELVDQDPNDEPAAQLLERIREERAAATSSQKPRGKRKTAPIK